MNHILPMDQVIKLVTNTAGAEETLGFGLGFKGGDGEQQQRWALFRGFAETAAKGPVTLKLADPMVDPAWAAAVTGDRFDALAADDARLVGGNYVRVNCLHQGDALDELPDSTEINYPDFPTPDVPIETQSDTGTRILNDRFGVPVGYIFTAQTDTYQTREHWVLLDTYSPTDAFSMAPLTRYEEFQRIFSGNWLPQGKTFTLVVAACNYYTRVPAAGTLSRAR